MKFLRCKPEDIPPSTGKKVAIIGAGPAGLTAAGLLICKGHEVHVFDKLPEPGGLLIYGIPDWRIPKGPIKKGIKELTDAGANFHNNTNVDETLFGKILEEYDAVLIATGAWKTRKMNIPGEHLEGVVDALEYLVNEGLARDGYLKDRFVAKGRVAVIGGGETAMDAAGQAIKDGADEVYVVYRRSINEAPSKKSDIELIKKMGVKFMWLHNPVRFIGEKKLEKIELVKMKLGEPDSSGRPRPEPIPGSEFTMDFDVAIPAIGEIASPPFISGEKFGIELTKWNTIKTDAEGRTTREGVFAAGDIVTGPKLIGPAVAAGRKVAEAIHKYLIEKQ